MRSVIDVRMPLPDQSFGMPKIPARKTSRIPTITSNFQLRFLFMKKRRSSLVVSRWRRPESLSERPTTSDQRLFSFFRRRHRYHGRAADFEFQIVGRYAQSQRVVLEADDRPAQPATVYDLVPIFQFAQHALPLFLLPLLRHNQQEVKNGKDEQQWRQSEQACASG